MLLASQILAWSIIGQYTEGLILRSGRWFVHSALGTSFIALCIAVLVYFVVRVLYRFAHTTNRQWRLAMRDQWNKSGKYQFFSIIIVYSVVFCFSIIYESHQKPTFSAQQIADYGYGILVAITDPNSNQNEGPVFH